MSLIHPLMFRTWETGHFKTPRLQTSRLQMDVCKWGVLKCPVSYVLNFRGWSKLIYDKITSIYSVKNEFNPSSEVKT